MLFFIVYYIMQMSSLYSYNIFIPHYHIIVSTNHDILKGKKIQT